MTPTFFFFFNEIKHLTPIMLTRNTYNYIIDGQQTRFVIVLSVEEKK